VLCTKTVKEHPMVLFIVVIVETFVHVQHKSNSYWIIAHSFMTRGLKNFAQRPDRPDFTGGTPFGYTAGIFS
jgi:hypothetical protein